MGTPGWCLSKFWAVAVARMSTPAGLVGRMAVTVGIPSVIPSSGSPPGIKPITIRRGAEFEGVGRPGSVDNEREGGGHRDATMRRRESSRPRRIR